MQRKITSDTSVNALTMESRGRQRERGKILGNHNKYKKGRSKSILGKIEFWNYGKREHIKKECKAPNKKVDGQQKTTQEANVVGDVTKLFDSCVK